MRILSTLLSVQLHSLRLLSLVIGMILFCLLASLRGSGKEQFIKIENIVLNNVDTEDPFCNSSEESEESSDVLHPDPRLFTEKISISSKELRLIERKILSVDNFKITGDTLLCEGEQIELKVSSNLPEGLVYNWIKDGEQLSETTKTLAEVDTPGSYVVEVKIGERLLKDTLNVQSMAAFDFHIEGPVEVCKNSQGVIFSVKSVPGVTYEWLVEGAGAEIDSDNNSSFISVNFPQSGTAVVKVIINKKCKYNFKVTINDDSLLDSPVIVLKQPENVLVVLDNTFDTYQWGYTEGEGEEKRSVELSGEVFQDYVAGKTYDYRRTYWVIVSKGGCTIKSQELANARSNSRFDKDEITVNLINVASGSYEVALIGKVYGKQMLVLYNSYGYKLVTLNLVKNTERISKVLPVNYLPAGVYIIHLISSEHGRDTFRFLIQ